MERYKAFLSEIKRENEKIGKKIRFVNDKTKFKPLNGKKVQYNKFFVNSYELEKRNNLCKYYKHKIDKSRRKKKGNLNKYDFPFFEIYKNTNPAFKNNLAQYTLLQMVKNYDELELFQLCSRTSQQINLLSPLLSHFIEIVIKKRDLYNINDLLLLTEQIKKLNYYHPYFCKLVCREVCLDMHKIKTVQKVTRFLDFLLHFNIFNYYYVDKFYKYITHLITRSNRWTLLLNRLDWSLTEELVLDESQADDPQVNLIQINSDDVTTLSLSFTKYKMIDAELLLLLLYLCTHQAYSHLRNAQTLYQLTRLSPFYTFLDREYSSKLFHSLFRHVLEDTPRGDANFVPLLKSFYTISKEFGTTFDVGVHNATLGIYHPREETGGGHSGGPISPPGYILSGWSGGKRRKKKKDASESGNGNENQNRNQNQNEIRNQNDEMVLDRSADVPRRAYFAGEKNPFAPFNCDANSNLKKLNLDDEMLIVWHDYDWQPTEKTFTDLMDTIKHVVLLIELKLLSAFPFACEKSPAEIEFLKRVNFQADREKNVHKYNAQNLSQEQRALVERLIRRNEQRGERQQETKPHQQDGQTQPHQQDGQTQPQQQDGKAHPPPQQWERHFDDSNLTFLFYRNYGDEPGTVTMGDINEFIKSKPNVKFNLTDGTYFAHIFSHLWQIELSDAEERILKESLQALPLWANSLVRLDVNQVADLFYALTIFQVIQGCKNGRVTKNKYGYSKTEKHTENDTLYKILSQILIKKIINIKSERLYKVILSCANTAYSVSTIGMVHKKRARFYLFHSGTAGSTA
ncbi:hypothetical protein C922_01267 [Plasmodium inui San Antonio 1]|uniref:Uncharacterized protein n=1 Tax=Plasmodium inui San Antonio 1 TaxID=1237626 RepID=W7AAD2_9APIC|nr:hypothetical protein C922_01267 [Plasmodium inui San Antonio 1]EUD68248.1 hypothetical protein C922_01267 [Plasmodium inui San Antonio 1]